MMNILFAGAGAMGARFGYLLQEQGNNVVFADYWDEHVNTMNEKGLKVNVDGKEVGTYQIPSYHPSKVEGTFNLIFVFTKAMQLDQMMQDIKHVITDDTFVICLLNGLGNVDNITPYVPATQIYLGTTVWTSGLGGPGFVNAVGTGTIALQQVEHTDSPFHDKMLTTLNAAGLNVTMSNDVMQTIWHKVALNCVLNTYCTLIDCNIGQYGSYEHNEILSALIVDEIVAVGKAEGVEVLRDVVMNNIKGVFPQDKAGAHHPSLYQDMANHRLTEIDYLNGAIARLGEKHGIVTPVCLAITHMIHSKENVVGAK